MFTFNCSLQQPTLRTSDKRSTDETYVAIPGTSDNKTNKRFLILFDDFRRPFALHHCR